MQTIDSNFKGDNYGFGKLDINKTVSLVIWPSKVPAYGIREDDYIIPREAIKFYFSDKKVTVKNSYKRKSSFLSKELKRKIDPLNLAKNFGCKTIHLEGVILDSNEEKITILPYTIYNSYL